MLCYQTYSRLMWGFVGPLIATEAGHFKRITSKEIVFCSVSLDKLLGYWNMPSSTLYYELEDLIKY